MLFGVIVKKILLIWLSAISLVVAGVVVGVVVAHPAEKLVGV